MTQDKTSSLRDWRSLRVDGSLLVYTSNIRWLCMAGLGRPVNAFLILCLRLGLCGFTL